MIAHPFLPVSAPVRPRWHGHAAATLLGLCMLSPAPTQAQTCTTSAPLLKQSAPNLFDDQQESALGDVIHEHLRRDLRAIEADDLTLYLERVGARLARYLPNQKPGLRFRLSDGPWVNALSLPGGRIFVTRKLIALSRDEDELAGVLAHELGHQAARHAPSTLSAQIKKHLKVTALGDRNDVIAKYHSLVDVWLGGRVSSGSGEEEKEQMEADQFALYAVTRAGYRPSAVADFLDRATETHGQKGSWLSDLFGTTKPDAKRLRALLKTQRAMAPECIAPREDSGADYDSWKKSVIAFDGKTRKEALRGIVWRKSLESPLQPSSSHLRFSPDGRFLLAQDEDGISVLTRDPPAPIFRIDAPDAARARFSPDSESVVFFTADLRVERWSVPRRQLDAVREIARTQPCLEFDVSSDGRFFACHDAGSRLWILDLDKDVEVFEKKVPRLSIAPWLALFFRRDVGEGFTQFSFSPDGRYFAAGSSSAPPIAFDLVKQQPVELKESAWKFLATDFSFLDSGRIAGFEFGKKGEVTLVVKGFPEGNVMARLPVPNAGAVSPAASGDLVFLRPAAQYAAAAIDIATGKSVLGTMTPGLDVHGEFTVNEQGDGQLDLRRVRPGTKGERVSLVTLPPSRLGSLRSAPVSDDLQWMAMSQRARGGIWNLQTGKRVALVRGFSGSHFQEGVLLADFAATQSEKRMMGALDLATAKIVDWKEIDPKATVTQLGSVLLSMIPDPQGLGAFRGFEAVDARTRAPLWSRPISEATATLYFSADGATLGIAWPIQERGSVAEVKKSPVLAGLLAKARNDASHVVEFVDVKTGKTLGGVPLTWLQVTAFVRFVCGGDSLVIEDTSGRSSLYSIKTGEQQGRLFARRAALSPKGDVLVAENVPGQLTIYDGKTLAQRDELTFASPIVSGGFTETGMLFVVSADQTAYVINLGSRTGAQDRSF